jgi:hypothetical protein
VVVTASKYNHKLVSALRATPIDYRTQDFVRRIGSATGDGVVLYSIPSAARGRSGVPTGPCVEAGGWCRLAWPRCQRRGCGSFRSA